MSFTLKTTQRKLLALVAAVSGVVSNSSTIPVLNNVVLKSLPDGKVTALGSDMEIEIESTANVGTVTGQLLTTVNCRKLLDVLATIPGESELVLSAKNDTTLHLKGANGKFSFALLPVDDFPRLENHKDASLSGPVFVTEGALRSLIEKTAFVTPTADTRYYLVSSQLVLEGNKLQFASTDGHRLARDFIEIKQSFDVRHEVLLPRKGVRELKKLLTTSDNQVEFSLFKNQARFKFGDIEFVTRLVEGKYPDINRVIPNDNNDVALVERSEFLLSVQRAAIFIPEKNQGVRLDFSGGDEGGNIQIRSSNSDAESVDLAVAAQYAGPSATLGINVHYLVDALANMRGEMVKVSINASADGSPAMFTVDGDENFVLIVMPMRL